MAEEEWKRSTSVSLDFFLFRRKRCGLESHKGQRVEIGRGMIRKTGNSTQPIELRYAYETLRYFALRVFLSTFHISSEHPNLIYLYPFYLQLSIRFFWTHGFYTITSIPILQETNFCYPFLNLHHTQKWLKKYIECRRKMSSYPILISLW